MPLLRHKHWALGEEEGTSAEALSQVCARCIQKTRQDTRHLGQWEREWEVMGVTARTPTDVRWLPWTVLHSD